MLQYMFIYAAIMFYNSGHILVMSLLTFLLLMKHFDNQIKLYIKCVGVDVDLRRVGWVGRADTCMCIVNVLQLKIVQNTSIFELLSTANLYTE
jgi:hypothetical protein